jgi:hypothetical protein
MLKNYKEEIIWDDSKGGVSINGKTAVPYDKEIVWDDRKGTFSINGKTAIPYDKELWFPSK